MTDERDPRLADFTDGELQRELRLRKEEETRAFLNSLGPCPECGAPLRHYATEVVETFRSAPKWKGWPLPPLPEYEQIDGWRYKITRTCVNDHVTVGEEVRFKDTVPA
jgi:hypothetical protein